MEPRRDPAVCASTAATSKLPAARSHPSCHITGTLLEGFRLCVWLLHLEEVPAFLKGEFAEKGLKDARTWNAATTSPSPEMKSIRHPENNSFTEGKVKRGALA